MNTKTGKGKRSDILFWAGGHPTGFPVNLGKAINLIWVPAQIILLSIFLCVPSFASDVSIALKGGNIFYREHDSTIYPGRDTYDDAPSYGCYIRYQERGYFLRADAEQTKTGNTLQSAPTFPYEGFELRHSSLKGTVGKFLLSWLYLGAGAGVGISDYEIEPFPPHTIRSKPKTSSSYHVLAGVERDLWKGLYGFAEVEKTWETVKVKATQHDVGGALKAVQILPERLDATTVWFGLGWRF